MKKQKLINEAMKITGLKTEAEVISNPLNCTWYNQEDVYLLS
ncbi:hypothetical protein WEU38_17765 [Cyanobacterium aponinum AL20118]|uniref:Uncharacterized protein n=1 Tax=Cyanobacterium aponinum AL20115 TaxID=3090662 RepID=A0AAF0ZEH9_9CHRO|nr:hypothetical protein [Cyanobacterium aponinum]WPF88632.1 hypothetical protein SAY89_17855 [Cyanobacterium aponinum AL20115]